MVIERSGFKFSLRFAENNNMKNITKTTKTILFASLIAAMILPFSGMMMAEAAPNENAQVPDESMRVPDIPEFDAPGLINENALNGLKIAVAKNPKVKNLLGDDYEFKAYAQRMTENDGWQPELTYYTDNRENSVTIVMHKGKVISAEKYENVVWSHLRAYAIDEYNDDRYPVIGLSMKADIPSYTHQAGTAFTAILLNAEKAGSNSADVCTPSAAPTSYWAQIGMQFDSSGTRVGFTDTILDCVPMFFSIPHSAGDTMIYWIHINDSTDVWTVMIWNQTQGGPAYAYSVIVANSSQLNVDTAQTSVWFENAHYPSNGWDTGFASDPVVDYAAFKYINGNYYYWFNEFQQPWDCDPGTIVSDIMSGTFVGSPHNVTFDVSGIEDKCDA